MDTFNAKYLLAGGKNCFQINAVFACVRCSGNSVLRSSETITTKEKNMKIGKITKLIKRHSFGCFTVEDDNGNQFIVQLAHLLEDAWNKEGRSNA